MAVFDIEIFLRLTDMHPSPSLQAGSFAKIAQRAIFTLGPLKSKGRGAIYSKCEIYPLPLFFKERVRDRSK